MLIQHLKSMDQTRNNDNKWMDLKSVSKEGETNETEEKYYG